MISYLIFDAQEAAVARTRAAYAQLGEAGSFTNALWRVQRHPNDGRAALVILPTPTMAGLGLTQEAYDALLSADERAALITTLPADWNPSSEQG